LAIRIIIRLCESSKKRKGKSNKVYLSISVNTVQEKKISEHYHLSSNVLCSGKERKGGERARRTMPGTRKRKKSRCSVISLSSSFPNKKGEEKKKKKNGNTLLKNCILSGSIGKEKEERKPKRAS